MNISVSSSSSESPAASSSSSDSPAAIRYDMRKFIHRIGYLADSFNYYDKAAYANTIFEMNRHDGRAIVSMLNDPTDYHHYRLKTLNERVQLLSGSDADLKIVWNLFHNSVHACELNNTKRHFNSLKGIFPSDPHLRNFADMEIFEDDYLGNLPPNGIRRGDVESLNQQYLDFCSLLKFNTAPILKDPKNPATLTKIDRDNFKNQVFRDVRILMSRPIGRQLIQRILNKHFQNNITVQIKASAQGCTHTKISETYYTIQYAIQPVAYLQRMDKGLVSLAAPPFIRLGHELIHLLHYLEGEGKHISDPKMDPRNTDPEEWRTIDGKCRCPNHQNPPLDTSRKDRLDDERNLSIHPISENSLRAAFDLLQRETHFCGPSKNASDEEKLEHAINAGADGDLLDVLPRLSSPNLDRAVRRLANPSTSSMLPKNMLERVVNAAVGDDRLRKGEILGILFKDQIVFKPVLSRAPAQSHASNKRSRNPRPLASRPKRQHLGPPPSQALTSAPDTLSPELANASLLSLFPSLDTTPSHGPTLSAPHNQLSFPAPLPRLPVSPLSRLPRTRRHNNPSLSLSPTPQLPPPIEATVDPDSLIHPSSLPIMTSSTSHLRTQHPPLPQNIYGGPSIQSQASQPSISLTNPGPSMNFTPSHSHPDPYAGPRIRHQLSQQLGQPSVNPTLHPSQPPAGTFHSFIDPTVPPARQAHPHQLSQQTDSSGMPSIDLAHIYGPLMKAYHWVHAKLRQGD